MVEGSFLQGNFAMRLSGTVVEGWKGKVVGEDRNIKKVGRCSKRKAHDYRYIIKPPIVALSRVC